MKSAGNLVLLTILKKISITSQNLLDNSPNISKTVQDFFLRAKERQFCYKLLSENTNSWQGWKIINRSRILKIDQ